MDGVDDWMSNTAGAGPADGAFERFLTAALAAIITLVFSWRLLGEVSESDREEALRRHVASRGRNTATSLGISDDKLREVAVAFAQDRTEKLRAQTTAHEKASEGSPVDYSAARGVSKPDDTGQANELSHELNSDDKDFIESLLKSSVDKSDVSKLGTLQSVGFEGYGPTVSESYVEHGHLVAAQECNPRASEADKQHTYENQTDNCSRLSDFPTEESEFYVECNTDSRQAELAKLASFLLTTPQTLPQTEATTTTPEDSDEDDFEDYYHESSGPRALDSDDETFYRTFLEPIQEELSGEDRGSSSDEWCPIEELDDSSDDSRTSTPRPQDTEKDEPEFHESMSSSVNIQSNSTHDANVPVKINNDSVCDKISVNIEPKLESDKASINSAEVNRSDSRVFENVQPSPEHKTSVICEPDEWDYNDDTVSETSDDTVIMVFSNTEVNGINQKQNEIVFLDQERYDGYRDMFLMEKIEDTDSDEDIRTTSNRYDSIRNNLTLIGSDDGESLSPCYDDYERGSWSDPDDNFRSIIPHYNKGDKVNFCDDSVSWNSKQSHKADPDFDFGQTDRNGYGDAPCSSAAETSPAGFTFVEVKDSFTEFSLRNYVRDKDQVDPKSDSGIFTDGEDFAVSNNVIKSDNSENQIVPGSNSREQQDDVNNAESSQSQAEIKSFLSIDSTQLSENQLNSTTSASAFVTKHITPTVSGGNQYEYMSTKKLSPESDKGPHTSSIVEKDNITPCQYNDSIAGQTESTENDSHLQQSVYDSLYVDTDNIINEAFSFHEDPTLLISEDDEGKHKQTVFDSVEQKTLEQTEITCWSSHTQPLLSNTIDIDKDSVQNDAKDAQSNTVLKRTSDHLEMIRASSPITTPSYYCHRQRRAHNEALILDHNESESEHTVEIVGYDDIKNILGKFDENESIEPEIHGTDDLLEQGSAKQSDCSQPTTQIDTEVKLPDKHADALSTNESYRLQHNTAVNSIDTESISKTTPINESGLADNKTKTSMCSEQAGLNDGDTVSSEHAEDKKNSRNSVILEESPLICLQSPTISSTNDDGVFVDSCEESNPNYDAGQLVSIESGPTVTSSAPASVYLSTTAKTGVDSSNVQSSKDSSNSESTTHKDISKQTSIPYQYTSPTDYKKLLKPTVARRYTSVLQRPISTEKLHANLRLPDKPVPKIRRKILASRQRFLSEDNLLSPNDSFEDPFSDYITTKRYHSADKTPSPTSPSERQSYSVADISRLYASTLSEPRKPRPCIDQLHENCILSPERLALIRKRAFSTESLPRRVSRQPSISSLVETDIDTGETSETSQFTETDLDVDFGLQSPVEKTVSMMDLRSGRSRFAARKKASEERKKSKSLQQLEMNIGSLETDIDAPFPDGTGVIRAPSEHELRVSKSLSKLNVPDWLRRSTVFRTGSHFILRRDSNASTISQWSSKSYGPLATTRDSSRASSCVTLSQPSPVVIKTRVSPVSSARLSNSPKLGSTSKFQPEPKKVTLPSAKFRLREKPNGLMPIPIVPFEKLKEKFEKKAAQNKTATPPQPVKVIETKIIVQPDRNAPPGILKQPSPTQANPPIPEEPLNFEPESLSRKVPHLTLVRMPPPKITITADKAVSAKDKTSPSALEKSVRFSPVLNRMDLAKGPNVMPPLSPEADYKPVNGGTTNKKPTLPPKPSKKLLKSKSSDVESTPKSSKIITKPVPAEKPGRIANLIRRFKGKDENSFEVLRVGDDNNHTVPSEDADTVFTLLQKPRSETEQSTTETPDSTSRNENEVLRTGPPCQPISNYSHGNKDKLHAHCTNTLISPDSMSDHVITNSPSNVSLDEVLGSLLALNSRKVIVLNGEGENNDNTSSISSESLSFDSQI